MRSSRVKLLLSGLLVLTAAACTCEKKPGEVPGGEEPPRDLKPLPAPPKLDISPESLPGAGGELAVVTARPQGPVRGEVRPTITFSKPVKSLEMVEAQREEDAARPVARIEPKLEGEWRWLGSASVEFVPKGLVPYSTPFKVIVPKGLKAIDGAELAADYVFSFETPRLELQDLSPTRGFRWMKPDETVKLLFNQPVKSAELAAALSFEVEGDPAPWKAQVMSSMSIAEERRAAEEQAKKEGRRYERQSFEARGFKNQQHRYVIAPERTFPLGKAVTLKIAATLHGEQGPLSLEKEEVIPFRVYGPVQALKIAMCQGDPCPYGPLALTFTNPIDAESLKGKLTVTPLVELDWDHVVAPDAHRYYSENESPVVTLPGRFKAGTTYQVRLAGGVVDTFGQRSAQGLSATVRTIDVDPQLNIGSNLGLIEASSGPKLPIELVNLRTLEVRLWNLTAVELARLLAKPSYDGKVALSRPADLTESQPISYARNQPRVHPVDLGRVFGGKKTGAVLAIFNSPDLEHRPEQGFHTIAQVTDLAVHLKVGPKSSLAWVTRLSTGEPVSGAEVKAYSEAGVELWTGTSDKDGFADVPGTVELNLPPAVYDWEHPYLMVAATLGEDLAVTADIWASGVEPYEFGLTQGWEGAQPRSSGFVFTDRGIYRPGDKVFLKGVARFLEVGQLKSPEAGSKLRVEVTDSRGEKVKAQDVTVTRYGTFSAEVDLPKESPTGYFRVEATGQAPGGPFELAGSFRVEEYRAPQFRVDVELLKKSLVAGEALEGTVFARYLFGGAMANARAKWSALREITTFEPENGKGFTFGQETWWWDDNEPTPGSGFFGSGEGQLDAKGALAVKAGVTEAPGEKPYRYTLEAEVEDVNRQSVAGRAEVTVHPASYYVGLRAPAGFMQEGFEYGLETLVLDTAGKRVAGRTVDVAISSRTWKSVKKKDATGGFSTVSEPVETQVATCSLDSADGPVPCKFKPASAGFYIVRAQVADDQKRKHSASIGLYATGAGFVAWQRNDTDRIDLLADKTSYDVGEVAHVLVKSPYPEAKALLTVEREGVLE
ncbi:MAG: MG2 domain-containing protein, partial [Myxococcaceae bacterium]